MRRSSVPAFVRVRVLGSVRARCCWRPGGAIAAGAAIGFVAAASVAHMPELLQARIIAGTTPMPALPMAAGMYVREVAGFARKSPYRGFSAFVATDGANSPILSATETASANV